MPTKIGFWNVEHWSADALLKAQAAEVEAQTEVEKLNNKISQRGSTGEPTRAVTRSQTSLKMSSALSRLKSRNLANNPFTGASLKREERQELVAFTAARLKLREAQRKAKKFAIAQDMKNTADHLFYCEVESTHPDSQSSKADGTKPIGLLCYASYISGASTPLSTIVWPAHIQSARVPYYRDIRGTSPGAPLVRCYFWHAPSANNGQIVADVYNHLITLGSEFILFGDLNCEPGQLEKKGVPIGSIISPEGGTRISSRKLDYAVTNVPNRVKLRKYLDCPSLDIKDKHGSDHAFMFLDLT